MRNESHHIFLAKSTTRSCFPSLANGQAFFRTSSTPSLDRVRTAGSKDGTSRFSLNSLLALESAEKNGRLQYPSKRVATQAVAELEDIEQEHQEPRSECYTDHLWSLPSDQPPLPRTRSAAENSSRPVLGRPETCCQAEFNRRVGAAGDNCSGKLCG